MLRAGPFVRAQMQSRAANQRYKSVQCIRCRGARRLNAGAPRGVTPLAARAGLVFSVSLSGTICEYVTGNGRGTTATHTRGL
eukprot:2353816-Prymnesium_polylepis.1